MLIAVLRVLIAAGGGWLAITMLGGSAGFVRRPCRGARVWWCSPMSLRSRAAYGSPRQSRRRCRSRHSPRDVTEARRCSIWEDLGSSIDIHKGEGGPRSLPTRSRPSRANTIRSPFIVDEAAASGTLLVRLAASGWHTAATTMKLLG